MVVRLYTIAHRGLVHNLYDSITTLFSSFFFPGFLNVSVWLVYPVLYDMASSKAT